MKAERGCISRFFKNAYEARQAIKPGRAIAYWAARELPAYRAGTVDILLCCGWNCDGGPLPLEAFAAKKLVWSYPSYHLMPSSTTIHLSAIYSFGKNEPSHTI